MWCDQCATTITIISSHHRRHHHSHRHERRHRNTLPADFPSSSLCHHHRCVFVWCPTTLLVVVVVVVLVCWDFVKYSGQCTAFPHQLRCCCRAELVAIFTGIWSPFLYQRMSHVQSPFCRLDGWLVGWCVCSFGYSFVNALCRSSFALSIAVVANAPRCRHDDQTDDDRHGQQLDREHTLHDVDLLLRTRTNTHTHTYTSTVWITICWLNEILV